MPHAFIVVYRHDDIRCKLLQGGAIFCGRCISCGHNCYANPSGIDAIRTRDAAVVCSFCALEGGEYNSIIQSLS